MGISLQPDTAKQRISRNVDKMLAQGASEEEVEQYLTREEGLRPVGAPQVREKEIFTGPVSDATRVTSTPDQGGVEDVIAAGLGSLLPGGTARINALLSAGVGTLTGRPGGFGENYTRELATNRRRIEEGRRSVPGAPIIEAAAGILPSLLPVGRALKAVSGISDVLPVIGQATSAAGKIREGAGVGTLMGALGAANETDPQSPADALGTVMKGGAAGGILGALLPATGAAATATGRGLKKGIGYIARPAERIGEIRAGERLLGRMGMDRMVPEDIGPINTAAKQQKLPGVLAHLLGESSDPLAYLAGQSPSTAGADLRRGIRGAKRQEGRVVSRGLEQAAGTRLAPELRKAALTDARAAAGGKNYPAAFAEPDIRSEKILETIQTDPVFKEALSKGVKLMKREGIDVKDPASVQEIVAALRKQGVSDRAIERAGYATENELPVQLFDYMKRGLDMSVKKGLRMGDLDERAAQITMGKMQKLLEQVDAQAPAYATARGTHTSYSRRLEALQAGRKAWSNSQSADQVAQTLGKITDPVERREFLVGLTGASKRSAAKKGRETAVTQSVFDNDEVERKLRSAYGEEGFQTLAPYLEYGRTVSRVNQRVLGGSATAERVANEDREFKQAATNLVRGMASPPRAMYDIPGKMIDAKERKINAAMQERLADILGIPIGDPRIQDAVSFLDQARTRVARDATRAAPRARASERQRMSGILANLLGQKVGD